MNLQETVTAIKQLPLIEFNNLLCDNDDTGTCIKAIKYQSKQHSKWLDYYLLDCQELWFELIKGDVGYYKPLGERTHKIYEHLKEIKLLSSIFQSIDINEFLYLVEREIFYQTLKKVGLQGNSIIEGKRQIYETTKKLCAKFENTEHIELLGNTRTFSPSQLMMDESITISKALNNYEFREHHRQFLKQLTRCDRLMYKSPLHVIYLKKNKLVIDGDGKRAVK